MNKNIAAANVGGSGVGAKRKPKPNRDRDTGNCAFCGRKVSRDFYCFGCDGFICDDCDDYDHIPSGEHALSAHHRRQNRRQK